MRRPGDMLPIGKIAKRTGVAVSAIRYYEAEGLVHPIRTEAGQRQFRRSDIRRISFVKIAQELGFSLSEIRAEMRKLPEGRTPTRADWERISRRFRAVLDARIDRLERTRNKLDGCIGCGCLSLKSCALYNPDDAVRNRGAGPRNIIDG
ncbi:MAG: redox-sensitive transcriptional activator SoxR [Rhodobacteraceae bacterium CG17_big_fil_post_rev_8_21_14_2_50_65_11]|nr:MAG: redox-sensitive transcriptional activator SoxR [Rhodobacteraceae bacterium CG17_big_fil_post_rev_8_21_14_2_50_65_11]